MSVYPGPSQNASPVITGPLSIGDLLDRTFRIVRARFGVLLLTTAVVMVPLAIVTGLLTGGFMTGYLDFLQRAMTFSDSTPPEALLGDMMNALGGYIGALLVLALFFWLGSGLVSLATVYHVREYLHGQTTTIGGALRAARGRLWPFVGMSLLQGLIIAGIMIVVSIVAVVILIVFAAIFGVGINVFNSAFDNGALGVIAAVLAAFAMLIGVVLLMILVYGPLIYMLTRWVVAVPSLMLETLGPSDALRRSWGLTNKRFWRSFGILFLLYLINALVLGLPINVAQQVGLMIIPDWFGVITTVSIVATYLFNVLWQPIYMTTITLLYYDLRVRQEAYDVTLRVEQLEQQLAGQLAEEAGNETLPA